MKANRNGLALWAAAWFVLPAAAAPPLAPSSEGPISDALALRSVLGKTAPPMPGAAVWVEKGVIEMESLVVVPNIEEVTVTVAEPNGKSHQEVRVFTSTAYVPMSVRRTMESIKFFTVTAEGKLQPLDADKAAGMLKQKTPVLTGDGADVDPRALELVKAGSLYLVLPPPQPESIPVPLPPAAKP